MAVQNNVFTQWDDENGTQQIDVWTGTGNVGVPIDLTGFGAGEVRFSLFCETGNAVTLFPTGAAFDKRYSGLTVPENFSITTDVLKVGSGWSLFANVAEGSEIQVRVLVWRVAQ